MDYETSRRIDARLDASEQRGGYILPCMRALGAEFLFVSWPQIAVKLSARGYLGGYDREVVRRAFLSARTA